MIGSFNFNGIESTSFGLICKSGNRTLLPAVKLNRFNPPGMSGAVDFNNNEYELREVNVKIQWLSESYQNMRMNARAIAEWLSTDDWCKLSFNDDSDIYYLAKISDKTDLDTIQEYAEADLKFICQPFSYFYSEPRIYFDSTNTPGVYIAEFTNPGTREINYKSPQGSKFLLTLTIAAYNYNVNITLNGKTLTYIGTCNLDTLVLDMVDMTIEKNGVNVFEDLEGDINTFLPIKPGDNLLTLSCSGPSFAIYSPSYIDYRPLFL